MKIDKIGGGSIEVNPAFIVSIEELNGGAGMRSQVKMSNGDVIASTQDAQRLIADWQAR